MIGRLTAWTETELRNAAVAADLVTAGRVQKEQLRALVLQMTLLLDAIETLAQRAGLGPDLLPTNDVAAAWADKSTDLAPVPPAKELPNGPVQTLQG